MQVPSPMDRAVAALDRCEEAIAELAAGCCVPGRSPRLQALAEEVASVRTDLDLVAPEHEHAGAVLSRIECAGAMIGRLQVTCCAPARMPLYGTVLDGLMRVQRVVKQEAGLGHAEE